jgi:hypothetical protein
MGQGDVFSAAILMHLICRTKICDPRYLNDTSQIEEISTKHYSNLIRPNITDVSTHIVRSVHAPFSHTD